MIIEMGRGGGIVMEEIRKGVTQGGRKGGNFFFTFLRYLI